MGQTGARRGAQCQEGWMEPLSIWEEEAEGNEGSGRTSEK